MNIISLCRLPKRQALVSYDMPDELIVLMVDNSMRIAEQLACTNIILRMRPRGSR